MDIQIESSRTPAECLDRLRAVSEAPRYVNNPFRKDRPPLMGIERDGLFLLWRNRSYNNSLQPVLRLKLEAMKGGTRLSGRFEIGAFNFWLLAAWYIVLFYFLFFRAPGPEADPGVVFRFALNTGIAMGAPALVWAVGTFLSRGEKAFVAEAVRESLRVQLGRSS